MQIPLFFAAYFFTNAVTLKINNTSYFYNNIYIAISCVLVYFYYYLFSIKNVKGNQHLQAIQHNKTPAYIVALIILIANIVCLNFITFNAYHLIILLPLCLIYALINHVKHYNLSGLKNVLLGTIWVVATIVPNLNTNIVLHANFYCLLTFIFIYITATSLHFDAFNLNADIQFKNKNIFIQYPKYLRYNISTLLIILATILLYNIILNIGIVIIILLQLITLKITQQQKNYWTFYFFIDTVIFLVAATLYFTMR